MSRMIIHRGPHHGRVEIPCAHFNCEREKLFADEWEKLQKDEDLLLKLFEMPAHPTDPGAERNALAGFGPSHVKYPLGEMTQRDAQVAAMVVQWMGTNIGSEWFYRCLVKKVDELRKRKMHAL